MFRSELDTAQMVTCWLSQQPAPEFVRSVKVFCRLRPWGLLALVFQQVPVLQQQLERLRQPEQLLHLALVLVLIQWQVPQHHWL